MLRRTFGWRDQREDTIERLSRVRWDLEMLLADLDEAETPALVTGALRNHAIEAVRRAIGYAEGAEVDNG